MHSAIIRYVLFELLFLRQLNKAAATITGCYKIIQWTADSSDLQLESREIHNRDQGQGGYILLSNDIRIIFLPNYGDN